MLRLRLTARRFGRAAQHAVVACGVGSALLVMSGCYELVPHEPASSMRSGTEAVIILNDAGRVAVGPELGPEVRQVSGIVSAANDSTITVALDGVAMLSGETSSYQGQPLTLRRADIKSLGERRFSVARSAAVTVAIGAAAIALIATTRLGGSGSGAGPSKDGGGTGAN